MKIAIVEDVISWQEIIKNKIMNYFQDDEVDLRIYNAGETFLEEEEYFQIIFMDIELKGENGFKISAQYKKKYPNSIVIILTTHNELWKKGYQIEAFRYIDKLIPEDINEALNSACKKINKSQKIKLHIILQGEIFIKLDEILYFETNARNVYMHTVKEKYECKENITIMVERLKEKGFFYIHRSYLVNMDFILNFSRKEIVMTNGDYIMVSLRRFKNFKNTYLKWKFEGGNG